MKLAKHLGEIASMLQDMHVKDDESKEEAEADEASTETPLHQTGMVEDDFQAVLEQRNILKEYCR